MRKSNEGGNSGGNAARVSRRSLRAKALSWPLPWWAVGRGQRRRSSPGAGSLRLIRRCSRLCRRPRIPGKPQISPLTSSTSIAHRQRMPPPLLLLLLPPPPRRSRSSLTLITLPSLPSLSSFPLFLPFVPALQRVLLFCNKVVYLTSLFLPLSPPSPFPLFLLFLFSSTLSYFRSLAFF